MASYDDQGVGRIARLTIQQVAPVTRGDAWFAAGYNSLTVEGLHVTFSVVLDGTAAPNTCTVNIANLAPTTRRALETRPLRAILEAGYTGDVGRVFAGDVREVLPGGRSGGVVLTSIQIADGWRAWRGSSFARTYRGGTPIVRVAKELAAAAGLAFPGALERDPALRAQLPGGYAGEGSALQQLSVLMGDAGYEVAVVDTRLQILRSGSALPGVALIVDADHGLVGQPSVAARASGGGVTVKKTLDRRIRPGHLLRIDSADFGGMVRCVKVKHDGDSTSGPWHTTCETRIYRG